MNRHPGGEEHTTRLLQLAALPAGSRILDMGAGDGEALRLMQSCGYTAVGIDRKPRSELVQEGDFIHTGFPDASFDGILSQCAFFVSGNAPAALREARRLLRLKGVLMLSDVFFEEPAFPGFHVRICEDMTPLWREYFLEALWRSETDPSWCEDIDCRCFSRGKSRYLSVIAVKEEENHNGFA